MFKNVLESVMVPEYRDYDFREGTKAAASVYRKADVLRGMAGE
ncbi:hypothetical protein [Paenibacillus albidus]|nr:hypothetical protein [Paenibacillus albidus]